MRVRLALLVAAAVALLVGGATATRVLTQDQPAVEFKEGEVLVHFKAGTTQTHRNSAMKSVTKGNKNASEKHMVRRGDDGGDDIVLATLPPGLTVADGVAKFKGLGRVQTAEPNYLYKKVRPAWCMCR